MNKSSSILHLLLKDLRYQRGWLALLWFLALLLPFLAPLTNYDNLNVQNPSLIGASGGFDFLLGLVLIRIIQLDPPGRAVHFLATRPVSWKAVLASKALFVGLFLLVPIWIAKLGTIYVARIPFNHVDAVLCLIEITIEAGALLVLAAMFALFIRSLPLALLALMIYGLLDQVGSSILAERSYHTGILPGHIDTTLVACRSLVSDLIFALAVGAVALVGYRTKSVARSLALLVAGIVFSWIISTYWPIDLSRFFSDQTPNVAEVAAPLRDHIHFAATDDKAGQRNYYLEGGGWNSVEYKSLDYQVELDGVETPYFATLADYKSEATLRSGRVIRSSYNDSDLHWPGAIGGMTEALRQQMAGFKPRKIDSHGFEVFQFVPGQFPKEDLTRANVKGVLTLEIRRAVILKTEPLRVGASVGLPRHLYTLSRVKFSPDGVEISLVTQTAPLTLRGDNAGWVNQYAAPSTQENLSWLILNRNKGECLDQQALSGGGSTPAVAFYNVAISSYNLVRTILGEDWREWQRPFPEDWGNDAQIIFFTSESCGRISFPYELPNVDLQH